MSFRSYENCLENLSRMLRINVDHPYKNPESQKNTEAKEYKKNS